MAALRDGWWGGMKGGGAAAAADIGGTPGLEEEAPARFTIPCSHAAAVKPYLCTRLIPTTFPPFNCIIMQN